MIRTIAIDGPAASGKTVVGREVAQRLGFWFLDTGIMYRAVTWLALEKGVSPEDANALERISEAIELRPVSRGGDSVAVEGRRVGPELRETHVDNNVSIVSRHPSVRRALVQQQRKYAATIISRTDDIAPGQPASGIVMIGRDIGTVVLQDADLKIFLTASAEQRAIRRCREMLERGQQADVDTVRQEIEARDAIDSSRDDSPLRAAEGAWRLDSSNMSISEVVAIILSQVNIADEG